MYKYQKYKYKYLKLRKGGGTEAIDFKRQCLGSIFRKYGLITEQEDIDKYGLSEQEKKIANICLNVLDDKPVSEEDQRSVLEYSDDYVWARKDKIKKTLARLCLENILGEKFDQEILDAAQDEEQYLQNAKYFDLKGEIKTITKICFKIYKKPEDPGLNILEEAKFKKIYELTGVKIPEEEEEK